jgi:hypothetical protein
MSLQFRADSKSRGRSFFRGLFAIATIETIDPARGVDQLLFARKERMTSRANFHV